MTYIRHKPKGMDKEIKETPSDWTPVPTSALSQNPTERPVEELVSSRKGNNSRQRCVNRTPGRERRPPCPAADLGFSSVCSAKKLLSKSPTPSTEPGEGSGAGGPGTLRVEAG